ncbi:MAG: helix-turn-helix domain-containing protein [Oscillospiraceae bacterium]|nr:helix-turn-helix domain-containing protein [Oscillospiraceae bacterium]
MDSQQIGALIRKLRLERGMTQKQLADALFVTPKTVSKWECGKGCPDVALLRALSVRLGVPVSQILQGTLPQLQKDSGNMKKLLFYRCKLCGNIMHSTSAAEISCCGRSCAPLQQQPAEGSHRLKIRRMDDDYYITFPHEMKKSHYMTFVAYLTCERLMLVRLYPEQDCSLRMPALRDGKFYFCCSKHGLFIQEGAPTEPDAQ